MKSPKVLMWGGVSVIALLVIVAGIFFWKYHNLKNDPETVAKETSQRVIQEVGKLYKLPSKETPTVARVEDTKKLAGQDFFRDAKNGDYILVYAGSKLAILYREDANQLINVGPINLTDQGSKPSVALLNGSGGTARLGAVQTQLQAMTQQVSISNTSIDAVNKNTPTTLVVDISGQNAAVATAIAQKIGGQVASALPAGETAPANAKIVIIVGKQ